MALQDHKENYCRQAVRAWAVAALLLTLAGCASGPRESMHAERMRLYRKYYNDLAPGQRREYLSGKFDSPEAAEQKLKSYAKANRARAAQLGRRNQKTSQIERAWRRIDDFLAKAEELAGSLSALGASDASAAARKTAEFQNNCRELAEALRRTEAQIKHTPYSATERQTMLTRNSYYQSRLLAVSKRISKSK